MIVVLGISVGIGLVLAQAFPPISWIFFLYAGLFLLGGITGFAANICQQSRDATPLLACMLILFTVVLGGSVTIVVVQKYTNSSAWMMVGLVGSVLFLSGLHILFRAQQKPDRSENKGDGVIDDPRGLL